MYVGDVLDVKVNLPSNSMYVEYVSMTEDIQLMENFKMSERIQVYIKVCRRSKIDQIHIRAVMYEDVEDGKRTYTHILASITSLILNGFSIRKSFGN